jgi:hypothetical protein
MVRRLFAGGNRIRTFGTAEDAGVLAGLRVWIAPIPAVPVCEIGPLESTPLNHSWPVSIRQRPQARDVWPTSRLPHFAVGSPGDVPPRCAARKGRVFQPRLHPAPPERSVWPNTPRKCHPGGYAIVPMSQQQGCFASACSGDYVGLASRRALAILFAVRLGKVSLLRVLPTRYLAGVG